MKKWSFEFSNSYTPTPLSYWVHIPIDNDSWREASTFEPPLPSPLGGKGYPRLCIHYIDIDLFFSSIQELEHFIEVLAQKNLPTSTQLSAQRGTKKGPNGHWLSRLPAKLKPWSKREKLIKICSEASIEFKKLYS